LWRYFKDATVTAKSSEERTRLYRLRRQAEIFSDEYMDGQEIAKPDEFIEAKEMEFCDQHNVSSVQFDAVFQNHFYEWLKEHEDESGLYTIESLIESWKLAEKDYEENT
jgi:hypothetical protein